MDAVNVGGADAAGLVAASLSLTVRGYMHRFISSCIALSLMSSVALAAEPCASDFTSFLLKFESSQKFQRQNTRFPLSATYVDGSADPEPKTVEYKISSASDSKYSRVIYPSKEKQAAIPFKKLVRSKQEQFLVQFTKPDTDYSFAFSFEKISSCWQLVKFEDYSL